MVVPLAYLLSQHDYRGALMVLFVAGLTDALDGYLARRFNWLSQFGSIADPLADKILLVTSYVLLGEAGHIEPVVVYTVLGRDVFIVFGCLIYVLIMKTLHGQPTMVGKLFSGLAVFFGLLVLLDLTYLPINPSITVALGWLLVVLSVISALQYFMMAYRHIVTGVSK